MKLHTFKTDTFSGVFVCASLDLHLCEHLGADRGGHRWVQDTGVILRQAALVFTLCYLPVPLRNYLILHGMNESTVNEIL